MYCVVPENIHTPPPPPHGRSLEIVRGRGDSKAVISEVRGGFMGLFQRVMNREQNIESNV